MQTDDEVQTTLPKWPFYLGDVLLVATALAIGILGDWQLTNGQVASCVLAVALGASLFVLPYVVEFQVRVREAAEDRTAERRVLARHIQNAEGKIDSMEGRIRELAGQSATHAQAIDLVGTAVDQKIAGIEDLQVAPSEQMVAVAEQMAALKEQVEGLVVQRSAQQAQLNQQIEVMEQRFEGMPKAEALDALGERIEKLETSPAPQVPLLAPAEPTADAETSAPRPSRAPRKRRQSEPRLLRRAIEGKQDVAASAVSRIISSKSLPEVEEAKVEASDASESEAAAAPSPPPVALEAGVPAPVEAVVPSGSIEAASAAPEVEPESEVMLEAGSDGMAADAAVEDLRVSKPEVDMFAESVPPVAKSRTRAKKGDAVLTVRVFIGIGNKPYLRGSGGGLNWEVGVVMDFEEIGKWRWVAPADLEEPIELQIYRNDETPDEKGRYILEPGQKMEVSPEFQAPDRD